MRRLLRWLRAEVPAPAPLVEETPRTLPEVRPALVSDGTRERLRTEVALRFLSWIPREGPWSEDQQLAIDEHACTRYADCYWDIVPWIARHIDLRSSMVIDVGCGTGSSTAAMAQFAREVHGYDIDERAIPAARARIEILGLANCHAHLEAAGRILEVMRERHGAASVDVVVFNAVLEHQTHEERCDSLRTAWSLLRPGGLLVVNDTPNRLTWADHHTSYSHFFHALPHEVAIDYARRTPRAELASDFATPHLLGREAATEMLVRWGRGISYHDFEIAFGDDLRLSDVMVGDGFDPEILRIKPVDLEERLLLTFWKARRVGAPVGFVRQSVDVILKKPDGGPSTPASDSRLDGVIAEMR